MQDCGTQTERVVAHSEAMDASPLDAKDALLKRLPEDLAAEATKLRRENQELRDTNELLKAASAFSHPNSTEKR